MKLPEWADLKDRRLLVLGGVAAVLVGLGVGLEVLPQLAKGRSTENSDGGFGIWPMQAPLPAATEGAAKPSAANKPADYSKLLSLFEQSKDVPALQAFAKEVQKDPELSEAWSDFKNDQESEQPQQNLGDFAEKVASNSEFRQLVAHFAQDPGFRQAALAFAQVPAIHAAMQHQLALADAGGRSRSRTALFGTQAGGHVNAAGSHRELQALFSAAAEPGGGVAGDAAGGKSNLGGGDLKKDDAKTKNDATDDAHNVDPKLASAADTGGGSSVGNDNPAHFCFGRKTEHISEELCSAIEKNYGKYGLWGACVVADMFEECKQACQEEPAIAGFCKPMPASCKAACPTEITAAECKKHCDQSDPSPDPDPDPDPDPNKGDTGSLMLGYTRNSKRELVVDPAGKKLVQLMFKSAIKNKGDLKAVTREIRDLKKSYAKVWNRYAVLKHGIGVYFGRQVYCPDETWTPSMNREIPPGKRRKRYKKPIVPASDCRQVYKLLYKNR